MLKPRNPRPTQTLFDPKTTCGLEKRIPFFTGLHMLADSGDARYPTDEAAIFEHVAEHEVALYEPRGWVAGPLVVQMAKSRRIDLSKMKAPWRMPAYVEHDALSFRDCSAKGVLLVQSDTVFTSLFHQQIAQRLNLLLVTGAGIPRFTARRLLYRLSTELGLPVYVLTDNSTWGYFLFSLLKRGTLAPHSHFAHASIRDVRHLGLRAGEIGDLADQRGILQPWKAAWDLRLRSLKRYPCFKKASWQRELAAFKQQRGSVNLVSVNEAIGGEAFARTFVETPMIKRQWLT